MSLVLLLELPLELWHLLSKHYGTPKMKIGAENIKLKDKKYKIVFDIRGFPEPTGGRLRVIKL